MRSIHHVDFAKDYFNHLLQILTTDVDDQSFYREIVDYFDDIRHIAKTKRKSETALRIIEQIITKCEFVELSNFTTVKMNQALILKDLRKFKEAIQVSEETLSQVGEKDNPYVLGIKNNLALFYKEIGNHNKSLEMHEEVFKKKCELYAKMMKPHSIL